MRGKTRTEGETRDSKSDARDAVFRRQGGSSGRRQQTTFGGKADLLPPAFSIENCRLEIVN